MNPANSTERPGTAKPVTVSDSKFSILHTEWSSGWGGQEQRIILECRKMQERGTAR